MLYTLATGVLFKQLDIFGGVKFIYCLVLCVVFQLQTHPVRPDNQTLKIALYVLTVFMFQTVPEWIS